MYAEWLQFKQYRVVTASSGEEACEQARLHRPDIILLDLRMPTMTGSETLRRLRRDPAFNRVPIVAFTAYALDAERTQALAEGFDAFLPKPCLPEDLGKAIQRLLSDTVSR
jgi:two-component system cell cycle response regulator DivK